MLWQLLLLALVSCLLRMPVSAAGAYADALKGRELNADEVRTLEEGLASSPDPLAARTQLLGYYFSKAGARDDGSEIGEIRLRHIVWIIEFHPATQIAGLPFASVDRDLQPAGYGKARDLWLRQTGASQTSAAVLGNAAQFFLLADGPLAEQLLLRAQKLEPAVLTWPDRLAQLVALNAKGDAAQAARALEYLEQAQSLDGDAISRFYRLNELAKQALLAGKLTEAERHARAVLEVAASLPDDWNYGNAIYRGNEILGQLALREGKIEAAGKYLLAAGRTPGSPQLGSFGPNLMLARDLLAKGQKEAVLEFFGLIEKFWPKRELIARWRKEIEAGQTPNFGANLRY